MSSIDKMMISGVRSFGADNPQVIELFRPLTIIVGHNGAGKTVRPLPRRAAAAVLQSIIESLKFATTGLLPPNSGQGKMFVNDPKLEQETTTKAQIKIKFKSTGGHPIVCTRQMAVTQKKTALSYSGGDTVLQSVNAAKQKVCISNRAQDINVKIPELMGVSRSILENVVFCHQEDSNWPLADAKTLKSKFDEIFAAARYTKALETMRKQTTELAATHKGFLKELQLLSENAEVASRAGPGLTIRQACQDVKKKMRETKIKIEKNETKRKDIGEKLEKNIKILSHAEGLGGKVHELKTALQYEMQKLSQCNSELEREKAATKTVVSASIEKLQEKLNNIQVEFEASGRGIEAVDTAIEKAELEVATIESQKDSLIDKKSVLQSQVLAHESKTRQCGELIDFLGKKYRLKKQPSNSTPKQSLTQVHRQLDAKRSQKEDEFQNLKEEGKAKVESVFSAMKDQEAQCGQNEHLLAAKTQEQGSLAQKVQEDEDKWREAQKAQAGFDDLDNAQAKAKEAEQALNNFKSQVLNAGLASQCTNARRDLKAAMAKKERCTEELQEMTKTNAMARMKAAELKQKKKTLSDLETKIKDDVVTIIGYVPDSKHMLRNVTEKVRSFGEERLAAESKLQQANVAVGTLQGQHDVTSKTLKSLQQTVESTKAQLAAMDATNKHDLDDAIAEAKDQVEAESKNKKMFLDFITVAGSMKKQMKKNKICKMCGRDCGPKEIQYLDEQVAMCESQLSGIMDQTDSKLSECTERLKQLEDLMPVAQKLDMDQTELTRLKKEEREVQKNKEKESQSIPDLEDDLNNAQDSEQRAIDLKKHAERMNALLNEIAADEGVLARSGDSGASREEQLTREVDECKVLIKSLEQSVEEMERNQKEESHRLEQLSKAFSTAQQNASQVEIHQANSSSLKDRLSSNKALQTSLSTEIEKLRSKTMPLKKEHATLQRDYSEIKSTSEETERKESEQLADLRSDVRKCAEMKKELEGFSNNPADDVKELEEQLEEINKRQEGLWAVVNSNKKQRDEQNGKKVEMQDKMQMLRDNIRLQDKLKVGKAVEQTIEKMKKEIEARKANLAACLQSGVTINSLQESVDSLRATINRIEGESVECKNQLKQHEEILKKPTFRDIDERVMQKNVETKTTQMATRDLQRYHSALDKALMRYHSMKMAEINKTLTSLWQTTYQGHDIDTVQLRHDDESKSATAKRNYNYRLVLVKNNIEMDMRGRCSAGQKVLAGLILRLALAETFGTQCGVLALDEPTTNLDSANIEAFAESLCRIIDDRSRQHNFQLIVITHDEDFVATLSKYQCHADHFYRVKKDENHHSVIEQCAMIDLG